MESIDWVKKIRRHSAEEENRLSFAPQPIFKLTFHLFWDVFNLPPPPVRWKGGSWGYGKPLEAAPLPPPPLLV